MTIQQVEWIPEERRAPSPYNFVPLPLRPGGGKSAIVLPAPDVQEITHALYATGGDEAHRRYSGALDYTLTTLTPLFVRGTAPLDELGADGDVRDRPNFFQPTGIPTIPGSSLRGMTRALVELLSWSKLDQVSDARLFFRDFFNVDASYLQHMLDRSQGLPRPNSRPGVLSRINPATGRMHRQTVFRAAATVRHEDTEYTWVRIHEDDARRGMGKDARGFDRLSRMLDPMNPERSNRDYRWMQQRIRFRVDTAQPVGYFLQVRDIVPLDDRGRPLAGLPAIGEPVDVESPPSTEPEPVSEVVAGEGVEPAAALAEQLESSLTSQDAEPVPEDAGTESGVVASTAEEQRAVAVDTPPATEAAAPAPSPFSEGEWRDGWLVCSGPISSRRRERDGSFSVTGKRRHWIVPDPAEDAPVTALDLDDEIRYLEEGGLTPDVDSRLHFEAAEGQRRRRGRDRDGGDADGRDGDDGGDRGSREFRLFQWRDDRAYWRQPIPCFFIQETRPDAATGAPVTRNYFGHTPMFRYPYQHSIRDAFPPELFDRSTVDLTDAIFGRARAAGAAAGRVYFEDAPLMGNEPARSATLPVRIAKVLSTPKPTSFQLYLTQDAVAERALKDWDKPEDQVLARGHKIYWHRPGPVDEEGHHTADWQATDLRAVQRSPKQYTRISPVRAGRDFHGRLRFENLSAIELGALMAALDLPQGCAHRLGMGKPLGLGSVQVTLTQLRLDDRTNRYRALDHLAAEHLAGDALNGRAAAFKDTFAAWALAALRAAGDEGAGGATAAELWNHPRLKELRTMLDFEHAPDPSKTYTPNMGPEFTRVFRRRAVLPAAGRVIDPGQPPPVAPRVPYGAGAPRGDRPGGPPRDRPPFEARGPRPAGPPFGDRGARPASPPPFGERGPRPEPAPFDFAGPPAAREERRGGDRAFGRRDDARREENRPARRDDRTRARDDDHDREWTPEDRSPRRDDRSRRPERGRDDRAPRQERWSFGEDTTPGGGGSLFDLMGRTVEAEVARLDLVKGQVQLTIAQDGQRYTSTMPRRGAAASWKAGERVAVRVKAVRFDGTMDVDPA